MCLPACLPACLCSRYYRFELVRDDADEERGDNYSHYSRPQQHALHHQHPMVSQHQGGAYPQQHQQQQQQLYSMAQLQGPGAGALQKVQQGHSPYGGGGVGGGGTSGGLAAGLAAGAVAAAGPGGEGTSVPSNPQPPPGGHKRKVGGSSRRLGLCRGLGLCHRGWIGECPGPVVLNCAS
jgi:hypothetical protein